MARLSDLLHRRRLRIGLAIVAALLLTMLLLVSFGWGMLRHPLERRLSARFGRTVTIGSIRRIDHGLFHPVLAIDDAALAQPGWAGKGAMVAVRHATVELPLLPLLLGQAHPRAVTLEGLRIALVRRDAQHANWKGFPSGGGGGGGSAPTITIRDGLLTLADAKRDHRFAARIAADAGGFRLSGAGSLAGHPSTLRLVGSPLAGAGAWPFRLDYRSAIAGGTMIGHADRPLDLAHFAAHVTAWGDDARSLDRLIEAGLPGTQPLRLSGAVRRDRGAWRLHDVALTVGHSAMTVSLAVAKVADRTRLDGTIRAQALDFDDLASDEGHAKAAANRRIAGPRLIPDTRIALDHLQRLDGTLRFDVAHLLFAKPSAFRSVSGTLALDHGVMTLGDLDAGLVHGRLTGAAKVAGTPARPTLTLDLRLAGSRVEGVIARPDAVTGSLASRIRLTGRGATVREAVGRSDGSIALVARDGTIARKAALFLGADAGRALLEGKEQQTGLRCAIMRLDTRGGIATPAPLLIDTAVGRADIGGTIALASERLALAITGRPKLAGAARLDVPIPLGGTIKQPRVIPPHVPRTAGTVLKLIGRAVAGGDHGPRAPDADCSGLAARALR